jgi:hypothetical protein
MSDAMPPGWYEDPWHGPGLRWWDGHQWTTHRVVPQGYPAAPVGSPPRAVPPPPPRAGSPPWWVWTLAALGILGPIAAFVALVLVGISNTDDVSDVRPFTPTVASTPAPTPQAPPYQPPHSTRTGPAAPGESVRVDTRDGTVRVGIEGVIDPVPQGGYYRGPHKGTRWVGVRLRIGNVGAATYRDDIANDVRLVAGGKTLRTDSALPGTCDLFPVEITLAPGQAKAGCVLFEVPTDARPQQLRFASESYFGPELATFTLGR